MVAIIFSPTLDKFVKDQYEIIGKVKKNWKI